MLKVVHLTSVHSRNDTRIFIKQCRSLAAHGYDVTLVVADDKGDEYKEGVKIVGVGRLPGRINRMFKTTRRIFSKAVALDADLYHLHDPELIPIGLKLKWLGKKVIFDSHEDVPKQLLDKPYLGPVSLRLLSGVVSLFERYACRRFDGIITATPFIRDKFLAINPCTVDINNFPVMGELDAIVPWVEKRDEVCYVGGIGANRGIREVVRACEFLQSSARLNLAGHFFEPAVEAEVKAFPGWERVNELGFLDRAGVRDVLGRSVAGLVTLHPLPNHIDALPIKMFEYMSAGLPVIASNFPPWREIIEGNQCGLCVDPLDPKAIASAIDQVVSNPNLACRMGENGRKAVLEHYNWAIEERKLLDFYARSTQLQGGYDTETVLKWIGAKSREIGRDRITAILLHKHLLPQPTLELGSGSGQLALQFASLGVDIVASDASDAFLNYMTSSGLRTLHIDVMNINNELAGKYGNIITRGVSPIVSTDLAVVRHTYMNVRRLLSKGGRLIVFFARTRSGKYSTIALHRKHNLWVGFREIRHFRHQVFPAPWYNKLPIRVAVIIENMLGRYFGICDVSILEAE